MRRQGLATRPARQDASGSGAKSREGVDRFLPGAGAFAASALTLILAWTQATPALAQDNARGEAIFRAECTNCHGDQGWGGEDGEYPRLAGLPPAYLAAQLQAFRDRKRQNKPMIPIFKAGRLSATDIASVASYLAALPPPAPGDIGLTPDREYDRELGEEIWISDCSLCHGADGNGKPDTDNPPLTRQYPAYLIKQIRDFRADRRWHEFADALFREAEPDELDAVLGHMLELNWPSTSPVPPDPDS